MGDYSESALSQGSAVPVSPMGLWRQWTALSLIQRQMGVAAVLTPIALYTRYINKDTDQIINQMINAVNSGDLAQTKKLLEAGHDVDSVFRGKGNHSAGVLSQAAMAGDLPMCQLLVSYGADVNLAASNQPMACPLGEAA